MPKINTASQNVNYGERNSYAEGKREASDLHLYLLSIIRELKALGEARVCMVMQPDVMCGVYEKDPAGVYASRKTDGLIDKHVGMVGGRETERIDSKCVYAMEIFPLSIIYGLHVCYVGKAPEAVGHDGEIVVHDDKRHDRDITNMELAVGLESLELQTRNARIQMLCKNVWHRMM